jgi:hypothetical protein
MDRQLSQEMGGGPEAIQAQSLPESREAIGSVSDQTRAQKGGRLLVPIPVRNRERIRCLHRQSFRVSAISSVACKLCGIAQVLPARETLSAASTGPTEPGDSHTVACMHANNVGTGGFNNPHDLVSQDQGKLRPGKLAVGDVKVRTTYGACSDAEEQLGRSEVGVRDIAEDQPGPGLIEHHRLHLVSSRFEPKEVQPGRK